MEYAVSLGSNLGDRLASLRKARESIAALPGTTLIASSPVYETEPVGVADEHRQKFFLNAVIVFETDLQPADLSASLREIEISAGRARPAGRNAPRTLDLDIIYAGATLINTSALTIPHPRWAERRFVVQPLADLRPDLILPGQVHAVRQILLTLPPSPKVVCFRDQWSAD